ncbi:MAG: DNA polymerase II [bacterium]
MPRGFLLSSTYRIEAGRPVVRLSGTLETGESFLIRETRQRPRFWIRAGDAEAARGLGAPVVEEGAENLRTWTGEPAATIEVAEPGDVPPIRDRLRDAGLPTYEADVRFAYRGLIDRGIRGSLSIAGTPLRGEGADVLFENPEIAAADWSPSLSVLSIDLETDPAGTRLLSAALAGCGAAEVLLMTPKGADVPAGAVPFARERDLVAALVRRVRELDPDVLTGWNFVDFDLVVLARAAARYGLNLALGRGNEPLALRPSPGPRGGQEARVSGRVVLDGIDLLRGAFLRFESYSLDAVAREVLGEGKTITGEHRAADILEAFEKDRAKLVEYNLHDARLALAILEKLHLVELAVERSRLTGMPPDRVAASIASFDFLYISELRRRGIVAPTVDSARGVGPMGGGHVLEPLPGLHENVVVLDFKSLYPSVIRTFQIDPLGWIRPGDLRRETAAADGAAIAAGADSSASASAAGSERAAARRDDEPIIAPNGAAFRREPAILPGILDVLFPRREEAKRAGDAAKSQAIKILMNSFYGVLGTPACRFFSPDVANAITSFGREILLWTKARVEAKGLRVLYGDTDSLFVESGETEAAAARTLGERLAAELNAAVRDEIARRWRVTSKLELEFDSLYRKLLLLPMRGGGGGARKRYAGLVDDDPAPRVVFTGMEVVRRDWTELAKLVQRQLYARLFAGEPVEEFLKQVVADVRSGKCDELLVYRKGLRKGLEEYTASTPPHVAAARKMEGRVGRIVSYVVTRDGPEPAGKHVSPIDREHYVQKQVRPVAEPVLAVRGLSFDVVVGDDRQMSLF